MALKLLSSTLPKVTSKTFTRKYIALGRIVTHWEDIIGKETADKAQPVKIHYRKAKQKGKKSEATLDIAVTSADAAVLHYQKDVILERINQIFGERWITDIKFKHVPVDKPRTSIPKKRRTIEPEDEKNLSVMLENIEDPDIKSRLRHLGTSLLKDKK